MFESVAKNLGNDIVQVCRLCLVEKEDFVYLFNPKGYQGFLLREAIEELLQEEISKEDGLPWTVCKECVSRVKEFKNFKTACIQAKISLLTKMVNRGSEFIIKDEINAEDSLSETETHDQEILRKDVSCIGISNDSSLADPLYLGRQFHSLFDIKEDADVVESCAVADNYHHENREEYGSLDIQVSNIACLPLVKEELFNVKEEVNADESLSEAETHDQEIFRKVEPGCMGVSNDASIADPLDLIDIKNDADVVESGSKADNQENHQEYSSLDVSNVLCFPLVQEKLINDCSMSGGSPKIWEKIVSDLGDNKEIKITMNVDKNACLSGLPGEHPLINMKKLNNKKGKTFKLGDNIKSTIMFSGMMPSELRHFDSHNKQFAGCTEYICDHCGAIYTDINKLAPHVRGHISRNKPSTKVMPEDSPQMCLKSRNAGLLCLKPFKCEICGSVFKSMWELKRHLAIHSNMKPFKCEICGKGFKTKRYLTTHLVRHKVLRPYKCDECGKGFSQKSHLVTHLVIHSGLRPFKCDTCGKGFAHNTSLVRHSVIHSGLRPYNCDTCGKVFSQKSHLVSHLVLHSGLRPYKCDTCGMGFALKSYLVEHSVIHSGLRPYNCDTCGKGYTHKSSLVRHSVSHSGLRPYKCDTCGMGFSYKFHLVEHSVIHSGLRPYNCGTCGKGYTQKSSLVKHSVIHSGLRPYKCDTCGKSFPFKTNLVRHSVMHSGLRPFVCDTCGKGFTQKSSLVAHSVIHSDLRPYKCSTCGQDFKWSKDLRKHSIIHS